MKTIEQTSIKAGSYYTIAAANGRVLEVADFNTENGASVRLWSYEGQPWQQWSFEEAAEGQAGGDALGAHDENPGDGHHGVEDDGEVA